jgi:5-methylcytosine-specific restriction endonuclease McrA
MEAPEPGGGQGDRAPRPTEPSRASHAGVLLEKVEPLVVLERHEGLCGICGEPVNPARFDVDHIVPLARGGEHSYANTQPAHPACNARKGARLPEELAA